ncbi:hypothetical protein SDC9_136957 [bioreactor metagenome]|uniref:Uncharacterized protein n=1 Tax=bioreactor metagenome TaxID=1076179 RepID=A0A645DMS9_9ZZZZ
MRIRFIICPGESHHAGANETTDVIYMAVGLIIVDTAVQPDEFFDIQILAQKRFDLFLSFIGVAVFVQQALAGGHERTFTIHMDGAAFQH